MPVCRECFNFKTQQQEKREKPTQLEVIKFRDDDGEEDSLLVVKKTPNKNTPGQPGDHSLSSIEKRGSNQQSPATISPATFSPNSD